MKKIITLVPYQLSPHVCYVINSVLGIFISTNKIFLNIQYFASQIFAIKNLFFLKILTFSEII
jgi:hypothetical protein